MTIDDTSRLDAIATEIQELEKQLQILKNERDTIIMCCDHCTVDGVMTIQSTLHHKDNLVCTLCGLRWDQDNC